MPVPLAGYSYCHPALGSHWQTEAHSLAADREGRDPKCRKRNEQTSTIMGGTERLPSRAEGTWRFNPVQHPEASGDTWDPKPWNRVAFCSGFVWEDSQARAAQP